MNKTFKIVLMSAALLCTSLAQSNPISGQGTWESTLFARDLNGDNVAALASF